jgi:phage-related holin
MHMNWEWIIKKIFIIAVLTIFGLLYQYTNLLVALLFMFYILLNNQINIIEDLIETKEKTEEIQETWASIFTIRKRL